MTFGLLVLRALGVLFVVVGLGTVLLNDRALSVGYHTYFVSVDFGVIVGAWVVVLLGLLMFVAGGLASRS